MNYSGMLGQGWEAVAAAGVKWISGQFMAALGGDHGCEPYCALFDPNSPPPVQLPVLDEPWMAKDGRLWYVAHSGISLCLLADTYLVKPPERPASLGCRWSELWKYQPDDFKKEIIYQAYMSGSTDFYELRWEGTPMGVEEMAAAKQVWRDWAGKGRWDLLAYTGPLPYGTPVLMPPEAIQRAKELGVVMPQQEAALPMKDGFDQQRTPAYSESSGSSSAATAAKVAGGVAVLGVSGYLVAANWKVIGRWLSRIFS